MHKNDCLICGAELVYLPDTSEQMQCYYCKQLFDSNVSCENRHYICDRCHSSSAVDLIKNYCLATNNSDPVKTVNDLMLNPAIKMHGPEHHFLVPAALLSSYYNVNGGKEILEKKLQLALKRSSTVVGGSCGFYGTCGAAIGTGIFMALITDSSPLASSEWQLSNRMTATALHKIADAGGPRCCKRTSFIAIREAVAFVNKNFNTELPVNAEIKCKFKHLNRECLGSYCQFYR